MYEPLKEAVEYESPELLEIGEAEDEILSSLSCTGCDCHNGGKCC